MSRWWRNQLKKAKRPEKRPSKEEAEGFAKTVEDIQVTSLYEGFQQLVELDVAVVKDGKFVYSPAFEASVADYREHPPSRWKRARMPASIAAKVTPALVAAAKEFHTKADLEAAIIAYLMLEHHVKRTRLKVSDRALLKLTYPTWYLNDHEPSAEEERTEQ